MTVKKTVAQKKVDAKLLDIAKEILGVETLEARLSDGLDFREYYIASIEKALRAAYEAGKASK